jgi:hypothetical protein
MAPVWLPGEREKAKNMESALKQFTEMTRWARLLLQPALVAGGLAVDLTAGNGHDTLYLWQKVGPGGTVVAFDLQKRALENTARRLRSAGAFVACQTPATLVERASAGVFLVEGCHSRLSSVLREEPLAVVANLGYLPGGDHALVTRRETTLAALQAAAACLAAGGRLVVTAYPGHGGGEEESRAVQDFFAGLDPHRWVGLNLRNINRCHAPFLLVAEKRTGGA